MASFLAGGLEEQRDTSTPRTVGFALLLDNTEAVQKSFIILFALQAGDAKIRVASLMMRQRRRVWYLYHTHTNGAPSPESASCANCGEGLRHN
jgi:hypothetical protein